ncbi:MAG: MATE family efflux transporter [Firmicutes bacterium]|nr:MATE family efflux transporter [Bacillota bacterium]
MKSQALGIWPRFKAKFIGDRAFYQMVLGLVIPVIVQNTVTNFVNLLDNVMVGSLGTAHLSGVAIANHLMFVFNLSIFGALSGAGIYGAQFAGAKDWDSFRETLRLRLLVSAGIAALAVIIFTRWPVELLSWYLQGEGDPADSAAMLQCGMEYLRIMLWGLLPFALAQSYSSALRDAGETVLPMRATLLAVGVNLAGNYVLIFGKLGFPAMGVQGAAVATVISRVAELLVVAAVAHKNLDRFFFLKGLYRSLRIGKELAKEIMFKGMPLFVNELLWSAGMITLAQILSTRGLVVVGASNIANTFTNLFGVFFFSVGTAVAIVTGQSLGAGDEELAKDQVWKLMFFASGLAVVLGALLAVSAGWVTQVYKTEIEVRSLAAAFMRAAAFCFPFQAIANCSYFAIRSGGRTLLTMAFDSIYVWVVCVPYTYALVAWTSLPIETLYPLSQLIHPVKAILGLVAVRSGIWARNLVGTKAEVSVQ